MESNMKKKITYDFGKATIFSADDTGPFGPLDPDLEFVFYE